MVMCPLCNGELDYEEDELDEGDEFTCDECGGTVRVASVSPIELEPAEDDGDEDEEEESDFEEEEKEDEEYEEEEEKEDEW